ncbi:MAG: OadG family protein [Clostridiales bacterium]|nr:OadG family protein [Clostridiales bacterium]
MTIVNNGISKSMILLSQEPLSERLKMASLNTLLGMGIVFIVLALMVMLISLFKYLPKPYEKQINKQDNIESTAVENTNAQATSFEEANLMNDQELVAVITAAIAAYQSEYSVISSGDILAGGFVVRSIRKVNRR